MKKNFTRKKFIISILLFIVIVLITIVAFVIFNFKNKLKQSQLINYSSFHSEELIATIDKQLIDLDETTLLEKENLILEKSIPELQGLVKDKKLTYEELTAIYLLRIKKFDQNDTGLNSVISLNEDALSQARKCDEEKLNTSLLYGIPVMLKDNINTDNMPTTAGTVALNEFIPSTNAELVNSLKEDGAVILGKNNLSEFANFMSFGNPNGYTNLKGQTINPYGRLTISTLGSSSGSAVAVTSNFVPVSIGTETTGSIVAPAAAQNVVGFRPSKGVVSDDGIIPLSSTLDTAGPIGKTVIDTTIAFNTITKSEKIDINSFDTNYLKGKTIALFQQDKNKNESINKLAKSLETTGAKVVYMDIDVSKLNNMPVLISEFNKDLNNYLAKYNAPYKTLQEIIDFNKQDLNNRAQFGQDLLEMAVGGNDLTNEEIQSTINIARDTLNKVIKDDVAAIAYVDNQYAMLPCFAGAPQITVPLYIDSKNQPHGATFVTLPNTDSEALKIAYAFESNNKARKSPILNQ